MEVIFLRIEKLQCDVDCIVVRVFILVFFALTLTLAIFLVIALNVFTVTIIAVLSVFCLSSCL